MHSAQQIYLTALMAHAPTNGPAVTFTALIPDLHHYKGSFGGRAFPLWANSAATLPNIRPTLIATLTKTYETPVTPEDLLAYIAAIAAHPAYTARFAPNLVQPGLRIPLTASPALFAEAAALGREIVWLHTFGERFTNPAADRPAAPPRLPQNERPTIPEAAPIPSTPDSMPRTLRYDPAAHSLHVGTGRIDRVPPATWAYQVSGKHVLTQWFSYRGQDRTRPIIGDRRPPSPLGDIQPAAWPAEYTTELLNVLNILGRLTKLEPAQATLLQTICAAPTIDAQHLAPSAPPSRTKPTKRLPSLGDLIGP